MNQKDGKLLSKQQCRVVPKLSSLLAMGLSMKPSIVEANGLGFIW